MVLSVTPFFLRHGWQPPFLPTTCACGQSFKIYHALSCNKGGFPTTHHKEIRDLTADLLSEVCHDVSVEPQLQPLPSEILSHSTPNKDQARMDVKTWGLWGPQQYAYFDVWICNSNAPSSRPPVCMLPAS